MVAIESAQWNQGLRRAAGRVAQRATQLDPINVWATATREQVKAPAFRRDRRFIERLLPAMELLGRYFDAEVRGFPELPASGPMLLVGNHSGGVLTPDTSALIAAWYRQRGLDDPLVGLAFDAAFTIPGFKTLMRKLGQVPANAKNAAAALADGASVLVYPGGVHEVFRPWRDRDRVDLNGRTGFVKLALRTGVPVVPVVGHGGHHTTVVLTRGERIARLLRLDRIRLQVYPLLLTFPWGITTPAFPSVPLPAKVTVQLGAPLDWSHYGPEGADDPEIVQRCYEEISGRMQSMMQRLAADNPRPIATRLRGLLPKRFR
jgi:1-acyl-sn-glycerol-3-phosphate acyltransferase